MGQFSWFTSDTKRRIINRYFRRYEQVVYMIDDKNNVWKEEDYEGYGVFGGKDYYILAAEMNRNYKNFDIFDYEGYVPSFLRQYTKLSNDTISNIISFGNLNEHIDNNLVNILDKIIRKYDNSEEKKRRDGINMYFSKSSYKFPILTESPDCNFYDYDPPVEDPDQGWVFGDEDSDDD